jgi:hypothetical protein
MAERAENGKKGRGEVNIGMICGGKLNLRGGAAQKRLGGYQTPPRARRRYSARPYAPQHAFPARFCLPERDNVEKFLTFGTQKHEPKNIKNGENAIKNAIMAIKKGFIAKFSRGSCFWVPFLSSVRVFGCRCSCFWMPFSSFVRVFGCRCSCFWMPEGVAHNARARVIAF